MGFGVLPEIGSPTHIDTLRQWLSHCDAQHTSCMSTVNLSLPTRVINVGSRDKPTVKLYETKPGDSLRYLALSHPWGEPPHFCTFINNVEEYKRNIDFSRLPATYRDAITITRKLDIQYLWIDSICIIQGPDGDFSEQAKRMEDVFSQAHCVLAASSAKSQGDGLICPRKQENPVRLEGSGTKPAVIISKFVDDFDRYVLQSPLNQRGWVLQERALARRTIYFTSEQTFWECGSGVRCETMTRMNKLVVQSIQSIVSKTSTNRSVPSTLASFLGDPVFPKVAIEFSRGGKIVLYQDLYMRYSRLGFSHQVDRPIAIAGLEKRLIQSLGVHGGYGVLDDDKPGLLRRSLLWCRGFNEASLERINFDSNERQQVAHGVPPPPSWSWMAHQGGIDYLDLPFDKVEWEDHDILSPWSSAPKGTWYSSDSGRGNTALSVNVRAFRPEAATRTDSHFIFDTPAKSSEFGEDLKCVILGRMKNQGRLPEARIHYVMLVVPLGSGMGPGRRGLRYERVGVGHMPGHLIEVDDPAILARLY